MSAEQAKEKYVKNLSESESKVLQLEISLIESSAFAQRIESITAELDRARTNHEQQVEILKEEYERNLQHKISIITEISQSRDMLKTELDHLAKESQNEIEQHQQMTQDLENKIETLNIELNRSRKPSNIPSPQNLNLPIDTFKEREYQETIAQLQLIIVDNQHEISRLLEQDKFLKAEFDKMERNTNRSGLNLEYLKNIVVSFLESKSKKSLIPVLAQMLQLTADETNRLINASEEPAIIPFKLF